MAARGAAGGSPVEDPFDADFVRRLEYWSLFFKRVYGGDLSAARRSREVGSGIEFADRRVYLPGDDLRYLDWKAYARLDRVLLRLFEEEKDLRVHVLLDRSTSMQIGRPPKLLAAKRLAAALAYIVLANPDRVSISLFADGIDEFSPPTRGKARIYAILETLRAVTAEGETSVADAAMQLTSREKRSGLVFVLSDFLVEEGIPDALDRLRYHGHEVTLIRLVSAEDASPSVSGEVEIFDAETGQVLRCVVTAAMRERYGEQFEKLGETIRRVALAKGARYLDLVSEDPFDDHIASVLRSVGKHR